MFCLKPLKLINPKTVSGMTFTPGSDLVSFRMKFYRYSKTSKLVAYKRKHLLPRKAFNQLCCLVRQQEKYHSQGGIPTKNMQEDTMKLRKTKFFRDNFNTSYILRVSCPVLYIIFHAFYYLENTTFPANISQMYLLITVLWFCFVILIFKLIYNLKLRAKM